jgi:transcriptional regulator with XRE-family HTH domain
LAGIGRRIAALRQRAGLTQDALSQRVLVSLTAVKAWEAGRSLPRLEQAVKLADCLGVSLDTLVHGGDQVVEPPPAPSMDQVDEANLIWALDFAERQAGRDIPAEKRVDLMLFAAAEFRRTQRMPPLPELDAYLLAASLHFIEDIIRVKGWDATTADRVHLMLVSYAKASGWFETPKP